MVGLCLAEAASREFRRICDTRMTLTAVRCPAVVGRKHHVVLDGEDVVKMEVDVLFHRWINISPIRKQKASTSEQQERKQYNFHSSQPKVINNTRHYTHFFSSATKR